MMGYIIPSLTFTSLTMIMKSGNSNVHPLTNLAFVFVLFFLSFYVPCGRVIIDSARTGSLRFSAESDDG